MEPSQDLDALRARYDRRLGRERRARNEAEDLLEAKSRALYDANQRLQGLADQLEQRVAERTLELEAAERRALALAERDQLTGIANRTSFVRQIGEAVEEADALRSGFALLLIDLDNFKHVNDGFGHDAGDALLRHTADRIAAAAPVSERVARIGGDEFAILLPGSTDGEGLAAVAALILDSLGEPLRYRDQVIEASCSIGIATYPVHATDAACLQRFADLALYEAKAAGRATFAIFDERLRRDYEKRHAIGSELRAAIEAGDVRPWFQPIVDARTSRIVGVEALARWPHRRRGLLSPGTFLGLAEERGLTNELFAAMLRQSCRAARAWIASGLIRYVSVNVSPSQLRAGQLAGLIEATLLEEGFPAPALTIEITEDVLVNDLGSARMQLEAVSRLGVRIALDDFGVGYSNIGYLRRLPLHLIKLDRILTADVVGDAEARAVLRAIIDIARTLDLKVVAEGVETAGQARWLGKLGCDKLQGFFFGHAAEPGLLAEQWRSDTSGRVPTECGRERSRRPARIAAAERSPMEQPAQASSRPFTEQAVRARDFQNQGACPMDLHGEG